jgi:hypothetical protein
MKYYQAYNTRQDYCLFKTTDEEHAKELAEKIIGEITAIFELTKKQFDKFLSQ